MPKEYKKVAEFIRPHLKGEEQTEHAEKIIALYHEKKDTVGLGLLKSIILASFSRNLFEAINEWECTNFIDPYLQKNLPLSLGSCACGNMLIASGYSFINKNDPNRVLALGYECILKLKRDFPSSFIAEQFKEEKQPIREKERRIRAVPLEQIIETLFEEEKSRLVSAREEALKELGQDIRNRLGLLAKLDQFYPEREISRHLLVLEPRGGIARWFDERFDSLPKDIQQTYLNIKSPYIEVGDKGLAKWYIYYANNRLFSRELLVGKVIENFNALNIDTTPILNLISKEAITILDASKILFFEPNIFERQVEENYKFLTNYPNIDIASIVKELEEYFDYDKAAWHTEFKTRRKDFYDKFFLPKDYAMLKSIFMHAKISNAGLLESMVQGYSIPRFRDIAERLVLLGRLKKVEGLKGLKKSGFKLIEKNKDVSDLISKFSESVLGIKNEKIRKKYSAEIERLKKLAEAGLYYEEDFQKLEREGKGIRWTNVEDIFRGISEIVRSVPKEMLELPVIKYVDYASTEIFGRVKKTIEEIVNEIKEYGGSEAILNAYKELCSVAKDYVLIEVRISPDLSLFEIRLNAGDLRVKNKFYEFISPKAVIERYNLFKENFSLAPISLVKKIKELYSGNELSIYLQAKGIIPKTKDNINFEKTFFSKKAIATIEGLDIPSLENQVEKLNANLFPVKLYHEIIGKRETEEGYAMITISGTTLFDKGRFPMFRDFTNDGWAYLGYLFKDRLEFMKLRIQSSDIRFRIARYNSPRQRFGCSMDVLTEKSKEAYNKLDADKSIGLIAIKEIPNVFDRYFVKEHREDIWDRLGFVSKRIDNGHNYWCRTASKSELDVILNVLWSYNINKNRHYKLILSDTAIR
ncbi:hypothetical protein HZB88_05235 [archaeon]|nr:hypothetical protein [archaeon]